MWATATATAAFRAAIRDATTYRNGIVRLFGIPESEIANTLRAAEAEGLDLAPLEITTCLRRGEIEIATRYEPAAQEAYDRLLAFVAARHADTLFSRDGSTIDEQVAALLTEHGRTVAIAESCTGGLMAARLTDRAGSSEYFAGGVVAYSNEAKIALVGVDPAVIERVGAVSTEVAEALADGAIARFGAGDRDRDHRHRRTGRWHGGQTGRARCASRLPRVAASGSPDGSCCRATEADIRDRSTTVTLHLLRRLLTGETDAVRLPGEVESAGRS